MKTAPQTAVPVMSWKRRGASRSPVKVYVALTALLFLAPVFDASAANEQEGWTPFGFGPKKVPAWFREAKLGMFIHWGPVSQVGQELSYPLLCCPLDDAGCDGAVRCIIAPYTIFVAPKFSTATTASCVSLFHVSSSFIVNTIVGLTGILDSMRFKIFERAAADA